MLIDDMASSLWNDRNINTRPQKPPGGSDGVQVR